MEFVSIRVKELMEGDVMLVTDTCNKERFVQTIDYISENLNDTRTVFFREPKNEIEQLELNPNDKVNILIELETINGA